MKKILCLIALLSISSCNHISAEDGAKKNSAKEKVENLSTNKFVENTDDIPLAKYLSKMSEDDLDFDSVGGSLSSVSYKSQIGLEKIKNFYKATLPQMGWKVKKSNDANKLSFVRENETLQIEFANKDIVKFFLESRS